MEINAREARQRFSELLTLAERGETIIVTRRGKPAVRLVADQKFNAQRPLPDLTEFRATIKVRGSLTEAVLDERDESRY